MVTTALWVAVGLIAVALIFDFTNGFHDTANSVAPAIANALDVRGLINVQYAVMGTAVYVIEANPRASRTVPFVAKATGVPLAKVKLRAPLPKPENIICMAVNYMEDGTRKEPAPINAFMKSPSSIIGDGDTMVLPDMAATIFEGEAEFAVVIGKKATNVKAADAMGYIFGYINFIDGSARGLPPAGNTFYQMKSRETFAPIGPWIVTADEVPNPQKLQVKLWVNGQLKQDTQLSEMLNSLENIVDYLSQGYEIRPGDAIPSELLDGSASWRVTDTHIAWKLEKGAPHTPSPLLVGNELYVVSDAGIARRLLNISLARTRFSVLGGL